MAKVTMRNEYVKCGKPSCRRCPHGPYWYGYWKEAGRTRKRYYGKRPPGERPEPEPNDRLDRIFNLSTADSALACEILGIDRCTNYQAARRIYRQLSFELHPDRGGDQMAFQRVQAAWSLLKCNGHFQGV